jgi:hypothetical protein
VVHDEIDDHAYPALPRRVRELHEVAERAVTLIDGVIVGDVITVIPAR